MDNHKDFFQSVIEQNKGILIKVSKTYCPNEEDRQDLVQEIMIQIWKSLHTYNNQFKITTWLYRISLNVAISFHRKNAIRKGKNNLVKVEDSLGFEEDDSSKELQLNLLEKFINELKEIDKALILLYLEDKSHAEISEILGISVSNVGTKIGRIKENLKQKFTQFKHY